MAINWPRSTLGLPLITGYQIAPEPRVARTEVAGGPPRFKRKNPTASIRVGVRWEWDREQYDTFCRMLQTTLRDGERAVEIDLLVQSGEPVPRIAYFASPVNAIPRGESFEVTTELEVLAADLADVDPGLFHDVIDGGTAVAPSLGGPIDGGTATAPADPGNVIGGLTPRDVP